MRSREEIMRQLDERMKELEAEAAKRNNDPTLLYPCEKCDHFAGYKYKFTKVDPLCTQPLMRGFNKEPLDVQHGWHVRLCGPERVLWEPHRNVFKRLFDWFMEPWRQ